MKITDNVNLLMCLNNKGMDKAYEVLKDILNNSEYIETTSEQLELKFKEQLEQDAINRQEKQIEEEKKKEEKRQELNHRFESEFIMINRVICNFFDNLDLLKAIELLNDASFWKIKKAFEWGYIQGKREERSRRKRGSK